MSQNETMSNAPLSYRVLASYGGLALPLAAGWLCLQVFVPTYYAEAMGVSLTAVGAVLLLARLLDAVTDPMIGYLSDHTPLRFGRRRLWILIGAPILALALALLFRPQGDPSAFYLFVCAAAVYIAGTMVIVPMNAWGAELSPDYHQRSRVSGARTLFGLLGTLAALALPTLLGQGDARDLGPALTTNLVLIFTTLLLSLVALCLFVSDRNSVNLPGDYFRSALRLLSGDSPFRQLMASTLLNGIANALPATLFLFFITHKIGVPDQAGLFLLCYFLAAVASVPLWVRVSRSIGKDWTWRIGIVIACLAFVWTPFLGPGDAGLYLAIVLITGVAAGADFVLPSALLADLIEWDGQKTGYRRPALFFAAAGTVSKLTFALAVGISFPALELAGFQAAGENSGDALMALAALYGLLPVALKLTVLWIMRGYPITKQAHEEIRRRLADVS